MKKFFAKMILVFFWLEVLTGVSLVLLRGMGGSMAGLLAVLKVLHTSVFGWVYLGIVIVHCILLKDMIIAQIKTGKLNFRYVLIIALFVLSFAAFVPPRLWGPYPISLIVHGISIPTLIAALMYMHIKIQTKLKAEREAKAKEAQGLS